MKLDMQLRKHPLWIVWNKACTCKATLDIALGDRGEERCAKGTEELKLAYMVDMHPHQVLDLAAVCLLQRPKAADIEWLKEVRGMRRHTKRNDVVFLAMELEFGRVVALVAVEDQQPVLALCSRRCMEVEVLDLI